MLMTMAMAIQKAVTFAGKQFGQTLSLAARTGIPFEVDVPAAKVGTLTVRTDNETGSLTMASGHGITTGAKIDLYWATGVRRNITVGTVATNVVPIGADNSGSGDALPTAATAITAMVPVTADFEIDGDNLKGLVFNSTKRGIISIVDETNSNAEIYYAKVEDGGQALYHYGDGTTNPGVGAMMTQARLSHGNSAAASTMKFGILSD